MAYFRNRCFFSVLYFFLVLKKRDYRNNVVNNISLCNQSFFCGLVMNILVSILYKLVKDIYVFLKISMIKGV